MKRINMLTLFTTNQCNLRCVYCSSNAGKKLLGELTLEEKKKIVRTAKDMGAKLITLCGSGEPMLDKDFYHLVGYIYYLGLTTEVVTNGTWINKKNAQWMYNHNVYVIFKLNSFNPQTNDLLVGKKNAHKWVGYKGRLIPEGLKCLIDAGFNNLPRKLFFCAPFQIQCIISKYNYKDIPEIAQFCKENNVYFFLESLIWTGRALHNRNSLEVSKGQYKWLYKQLLGKVSLGFLLHQKRVSCVLEKNPVVGVTGEVWICSSRKSNVGNVRDKPLEFIYKETQALRKKQEIPFYKGLCSYFKTCAGREYFKKVIQ